MEVLKLIPNYTAYLVLSVTLLGCIEENVAPEAENDSTTISQGESVIIKVLENDTDTNDDPLEVTNLTSPEYGRITLQSDGSVLYQHDGSATADDSFTYTAFDGAAESKVAVVSITIELNENGSEDTPGGDSDENNNPPTTDNRRPVARDDQIQIAQGESQSLNLIQNDEDPDGDPLQIVTLTNPLRGTVRLQTDGVTVVYSHDGSDTTQDNFSYIVSDGQHQSQAAQVTITISANNHVPEFTRSGSNASVPVDVLYSLTYEANDPDGDELSYHIDGLPYWLVHTPSSRVLSGSPSWEDLGSSYSIIISASDGKTTAENRFTISVSESQSVTDSMAHRLLQQSTFGPVESEIARVKSLGISGWVDSQLSMNSAYTSASDGWKTHLERTQEIALKAEPSVPWYSNNQVFSQASSTTKDYQMAAWWENALSTTAPQRGQIGTDQLRQRVAYSLSQLLVVSTSSSTLSMRGEALAAYYDLLTEHAFRNYRDLLGEIATSPAMGVYLSHQGNSKADPSTGARPDENFAREIIQLFSIGLYELNLDGSPNRDGNSSSFPDTGTNTVPTYTQTDIEELAKVMTGWDLAENNHFGRLNNRSGDYTQPMVFHPSEHEDESAEGGDGNITLLGVTFPLNSGQDHSGLDKALDTLFAHPNIAPYVSKHLIQRLVTSNPTSNYVARIASVFNNNGQGIKGDLKAVVRAILLDPEARDDSYRTNPAFGKAKEPLLALTQLLRATHVTPLNGWKSRDNVTMDHIYWFRNPENSLNQGALRSPSVFNFYNPHHVPSDDYFTTHQLVGPEFQIQTSQMLADYNNLVFQLLTSFEKNKITHVSGKSLSEFSATRGHYSLSLLTNFDTELSLFEQALENDSNGDFISLSDNTPDNNGDTPKAHAIDALIDHIDLVMLGRTMSDNYRAALKHYLLSNSYTNSGNNRENVRRMVQDTFTLVATSSDYMIQK
ncbi:MAG: DUF1800 family protein [Candidatus Thiodiazotropha sp. LLP2]